MKSLPIALLGVLSLSACAQGVAPPAATAPATTAGRPAAAATPATPASDPRFAPGTPEARVRDALEQLSPGTRVERIGPAPIPGFREAIVSGQVVYVSDDGKYLLQGSLFDIASRRDLGEATMAGLRRDLLKTVPVSDRIVFAPPNPKYTVSVFTDIECGYCRKLHSQIAEYNRQGIAIQYLAFPRMGLGSADFRKMISVWCAPDPRKALTDAKNDRAVPQRDCRNPVTMEYALGKRVGLEGTPMIIGPEGHQLGGYVPPAQLRAKLDALAAEQASASPAAGAAAGKGGGT